MEQEYETIDLREIFAILKNNIILIVAATVIAAVVGGLVTMFLITPQYEAEAAIIVNTRQDQNASVTNDQLTSAKNLVPTYSIIIKSDTVLNPVIKELSLDMTYDQLKAKVTVSALDATQVMGVSVRDPDPALAKSIVAKIVEVAPEIVRDMVEAGSVKVVSAARVGEKPVSPKAAQNIAISALVGLVLSVGYAFLREMLNNTFKTDEDLHRHLGVVVLGVIPEVEV